MQIPNLFETCRRACSPQTLFSSLFSLQDSLEALRARCEVLVHQNKQLHSELEQHISLDIGELAPTQVSWRKNEKK